MTWTPSVRSADPCMQLQIRSASRSIRTPQMLHATKEFLGVVTGSPHKDHMAAAAAASRRHLLLLVVVVLAVTISLRRTTATAAVTVEEACRQYTRHPAYCAKALSSATAPESRAAPSGLPALAVLSVSLAAESGAKTVSFVRALERVPGGMPLVCLEACVGKFQAAVAELRRSRAALVEHRDVARVKAWVAAARADGETCMDGCHQVEGGADPAVADKIRELAKLCSIALSLTDAAARKRTM